MVVDAVGEPDPLDVGHERCPARVGPVALVAPDDGVERPDDLEVVLVVLVDHDVTAADRRLAEVIDQLLLARAEGLEAGHLIAQDPQVGELVDLPLELGRGRGGGRGGGLLLFAAGDHEDQAGTKQGQDERALDVHGGTSREEFERGPMITEPPSGVHPCPKMGSGLPRAF